MRKHLIILSTAILASACSQTPAPYDVYGTHYYGKNVHTSINNSTSSSSGPLLKPDDYNNRIDAENSTRVLSRPLSSAQDNSSYNTSAVGGKPGEVYSHQVSDNSGISRRPLAPTPIDGDQQVVRLNNAPRSGLIHSGNSLGNGYAANGDTSREAVRVEETVPPVEHKEGFINPPEANAERKSANNLSKIKPLAKPKYQEEEESEEVTPAAAPVPVQHDKTRIAAKIQKVETASGDIEPSTAQMAHKQGLLNKPAPAPATAAVSDDTADNDDEDEAKPATAKTTAAAVEKVPPVKLVETKPNDAEAAAADEDEAAPAKAQTQTAAAKPAAKSTSQFIKPVDGVVISEFGNDKSGAFNDGINIQAPEGTPVKAAGGGTVVYSGNQLQGYGNMIIIKHPNGYLSAYSHLKELELKKGETVEQGHVVGHVGKTGNVDTPQLHFGIRKGHEPVDPKSYI